MNISRRYGGMNGLLESLLPDPLVTGAISLRKPVVTLINQPQMEPATLVANRQLTAEAANAAVIYEQFVADGRRFTVACLGYVSVLEVLEGLTGASALERGQHMEALHEGLPVMLRFAAIGDDGNVYAVWEVYASENNSYARMVSKTLQVDGDWTGRGIGANFAYVVRQNAPVQWSDKFTQGGTKLKERVEAMEKVASEP